MSIKLQSGQGSLLPATSYRWLKVNSVETGFLDTFVRGETFKAVEGPKDFLEFSSRLSEELFKNPRGISEELVSQAMTSSNYGGRLLLNEGDSKRIEYHLSDENNVLIDRIQLDTSIGARAELIVLLDGDNGNCYRNGLMEVKLSEDSELHLVLVNRAGENTNNNFSLIADMADGAELKLTTVEMGSKRTNFYYSGDLLGFEAKNDISTAYLAYGDMKLDIFYNIGFFNHYNEGYIDANGALLDRAYKSFRDTLDFKEGSEGAIGNESEFTILLSEEARSISVPILLCHEDLVQANHAASDGKIDPDQLFYIMSRGFSKEEAEGMLVEARMTPTLDRIIDLNLRDELKKEIHERIVKRYESAK